MDPPSDRFRMPPPLFPTPYKIKEIPEQINKLLHFDLGYHHNHQMNTHTRASSTGTCIVSMRNSQYFTHMSTLWRTATTPRSYTARAFFVAVSWSTTGAPSASNFFTSAYSYCAY